MKAIVQTLALSPATSKPWVTVLADLFKARLTFLVLLTAWVGFCMGSPGTLDWRLMFHALAGTGFLAAGASALNQLIERNYDAKMKRTASRPLPAGLLQPDTVLALGCGCCLTGLLYLAVAVNTLTFCLGALTVSLYLFAYTPLKRVTWLNTLAGAIPGALPPLMGWTAARNDLAAGGLALFAIQFCWQMPHFLAIAWIYQDDYAKAGFRMLPLENAGCRRTGRQAAGFALGLTLASLCPWLLGLTGMFYLFGAMALGTLFAGTAMVFARQHTPGRARQLFFASILYLPLLMGLMVWDKLKVT